MKKLLLFFAVLFFFSCKTEKQQFDFIIRHGTIYDGSGGNPFTGDIGINGDTIAQLGRWFLVKRWPLHERYQTRCDTRSLW